MDEEEGGGASEAVPTEVAPAEDWSHLGAELLGRLLDELPMPVGVVDPDGRIPFQNRRVRELFGFALDEVSHVEVFRRLVYPDDSYRAEVVQSFRAAAERAKVSGAEFRFGPIRMRTRGGGDHEVEIAGTFVGERLVVVFDDVTDKLRME